MSPRIDKWLEKASILARVSIPTLFAALVPGFVPRGTNTMARCPLHEDSTSSWSGNVDTGQWNCFGCGAKGDVIGLVEQVHRLDFRGALEWLARFAGAAISEPATNTTPKQRKHSKEIWPRIKGGVLTAQYSYGERWIKARYPLADGKKTFLWFERVADGYLSGLGGAFPGLYVRGDLSLARAFGEDVWLHEGEKAVDRFAAAGHGLKTWPCAVCGPNGAESWSKQGVALAELLAGVGRVIAVVDRDKAGLAWARDVQRALEGKVGALRLVQTPLEIDKADAHDHLEAGLGLGDFVDVEVDQEVALDHKLVHSAPNSASTAAPTPDENLTDLGNCRLMARMHGRDIHYVPGLGWLVWLDGRWVRDEDGSIARRAKSVCDELNRIVHLQDTDEQRKRALKHAQLSEGASRIRAMIELVQSEPGVTIPASQLDAGAWHLNTPTGVLDLQSGQVREHKREDLLTRWTGVPYDATARCPRFVEFLMRIMEGNGALISFLQRAIGYSLTGSTREQKLFLCYGTGANGKSTLIEVLRETLGAYARSAPFDAFCESFSGRSATGPNEDIARLAGARFVSAVEGGESSRLNEGLVKQLTGGDMVSASYKYGAVFEYRPQFKIWLSTNHLPRIRGTDEGIWRRICRIPFNASIPAEEQDHDLLAKLREERAGILAWAVAGALQWARGGLQPPEEVVAATQSYRQESDVLGQFIEECCIVDRLLTCKTNELYRRYRVWCEDNGHSPMSQTSIGKRLQERGFEAWRMPGLERSRAWKGIDIDAVESPPQPHLFGRSRRDWTGQ